MYSISQLAKEFGISRSTLLYYDEKGLLKPESRSAANYRRYSQHDYLKLQQIMMYRNAGISLDNVARLITDESSSQTVNILEKQLSRLNDEISALRKQQKTIINMLDNDALTDTVRSMDKDQWVELLKSTGLNDKEMKLWHVQFEKSMPEAHQDFLESLNIDEEEISEIRQWSRGGVNSEQIS